MAKKKTTRRKSSTRTHQSYCVRAQRFAASLLDPAMPPDLGDAMAEDVRFSNAFESLQREIYIQTNGTEDSRYFYERVKKALPQKAVADLIAYSDREDWQELAARDAAYLVGVAVGLRMAGGAR